MMGRGADGGCGTEERPCPVSRAPSSSLSLPRASSTGVDLLSQARKALSERSPFASEEESSRVPTLPVALASSLDGRRRPHHKKRPHPPANPAKKSHSASAPPVATVWERTEEYFRSITFADLDLLSPPAPHLDNACLRIPLPTQEVAPDPDPAAAPVETVGAAHAEGEAGEAEREQVEDMEIDEEVGNSPRNRGDPGVSLVTEEPVEMGSGPSLNWLLGSKHRVLLTTERPTKKRKLLGSDAGLERVLRLPLVEDEERSPSCNYCCNHASVPGDLLHCERCNATVHGKCYGVSGNCGAGAWVCSWCKYLEEFGKKSSGVSESHPCCWLCPREGGALKPVDEGGSGGGDVVRFVHLFCSLWMPELYVENMEAMEPIMNVEGVPETRRKLLCNLCKVKHGACVRCSHGACRASFHPSCARETKHKMEIWGKVGCNNVELRAFCAKHSEIQESTRHPNTRSVTNGAPSHAEDILTTGSSSDNVMQTNFSSLTRDESVSQQNDDDLYMERLSGNEKQLDDNVAGVDSRHESHESWQDGNVGTSGHADDNRLSLPKFLLILKKLIEKGKVDIHDIASETGILLDTLESVIRGDSSILSSEMQLKLIKWLQNSVFIGASSRHLKLSNDAAFLGGKEADNTVTDALEDLGAVIVAEVDTSDVIVKSLPPRRRTKGNIGILKENEVVTSTTDVVVQKEFNTKICSETVEIPHIHNNGVEAASAFQSSIGQDCSKEKQVSGLPMGGDFSCITPSSFKELQHEKENIAASIGSDVHHQEFGLYQTDNLNKKFVVRENTDASGLTCDVPDPQVSISIGSCVHPWIHKRLIEMGFGLTKQNLLDDHYIDHRKIEPVLRGSVVASNKKHLSQHDNGLVFEESNNNKVSETKILEVFAKARELGITNLSPEDELEGEILRLQSKLLSATFALKSRYDNLIFKVVSAIPAELEALKKRRWDMLLVNQYLREVREAKKRGRKERRHREAQAILAAATAGAASSRVSSLRKDAKDEINSIHDKQKLKVNATCANSESYPLERKKERPLKLVVSKLSSGMQSDASPISCDVCRRPETLMKPIFVCGRCKVAVHLGCYRRSKDPISSWYCEPCQVLNSDSCGGGLSSSEYREKSSFIPQCCFCGTTAGAFRQSSDGKWVHAFCAEWVLGSKFRRGQEHLVEGVDTVLKTREAPNCCICHQNIGVCIKCSYGHCQTAFHPICARGAGWFMNVKTIGGNTQHKAYCEKHSQEQREKAEFQHGAEEFKNLRQTRVELEKLRLLCERIIKREKLKRELLVCSHDILAARRTYVAKAMFARSSFLSSGFSSESATTSINNTSYSGTVDRSDDVTVDSTVSKKRRAIPSLHIRLDRTGEAPIRSNPPSTRVANDRASFSGKQLPQRPSSYDKVSNDGKRPSKTGKHRETMRKELHVASDRALFQNQRSSEAFVYLPAESMSKSQDVDSCEPPQPDG